MSDWDALLNDPFDETTTLGETDQGVGFDDCVCVAESQKALRVQFADGTFRWVPRSQLAGGTDPEIAKKGDKGTLYVSAWLARKWEGDEPEQPEDAVELPGVVVLRETAKAIEVRLEDGREEWIPKTQIAEGSEVTGDGDSGMLKVTQWLAKTKNL